MKALILVGLIACCLNAISQHIVIQAGSEKTIAGSQYVTTAGIENKKQWGLGMFYQTQLGHPVGEQTTSLAPFYGFLFQAPIVSSDKLTFLATLRTGWVNQQFFIVVPAAETRIKFSNRTGLAIGAGLRMSQPSLHAKVFFKLL